MNQNPYEGFTNLKCNDTIIWKIENSKLGTPRICHFDIIFTIVYKRCYKEENYVSSQVRTMVNPFYQWQEKNTTWKH